jgi:iron complex transport system ATP-binding protein
MAVLEAVLLGRHPWQPAFAFEGDEDLRLAREALHEVDAEHLAERDLSELSGGERQRVLLARALCQGGRVLLCDEPTSHLDIRHQAAVFRLLRSVADAGRAVVVVTHDVNLAAQACDRLAFLREGDGGGATVTAAARRSRPPDLHARW